MFTGRFCLAKLICLFSAFIAVIQSCTTVGFLKLETHDDIVKSIRENDFSTFQTLITSYSSMIEQKDYQFFLQIAYESSSGTNCPVKFVKRLIEIGATPIEVETGSISVSRSSNRHLVSMIANTPFMELRKNIGKNITLSFEANCDDLKTLTIEKSSGDQIMEFVSNNLGGYKIRNPSELVNKPEFSSLLAVTSKGCKQDDKNHCKSEAILKGIVDRKNEDEANKIKEASKRIKSASSECEKARIVVSFCNASTAIVQMKNFIDHEKNVGNLSGFVDRKKIHDSTSTMVLMDGYRKQDATKYLQMTKKKLSESVCGIKNNSTYDVQMDPDIERARYDACGD